MGMVSPDLWRIYGSAWIYAGGAHHTAFSMALTPEYLEDFAKMADVEFVLIDEKTFLSDFQKELRSNEIFYALARGL
jgi:L-arabinose isomerase